MISDAESVPTFAVMRQLRTHVIEGEYLVTTKRLRHSGYRMAAIVEAGEVRYIAGFRIVEFLAHGKFLYVDHLVAAESARSEGHGKRMLDWLTGVAREEGCRSLQLDSGVQRHEAHRFYFQQETKISGNRFSKAI
ncbi:MAG: GNAT family N-acetyltransferase [Actinomycetota bacterium]|nr:GNAT family N-acetyltransferase [Actinomycetota bacterium]